MSKLQSTSTQLHTPLGNFTTEFLVYDLNPLYTGGLFHCYVLGKSICHFRGVYFVTSILFLM